MNTNEGPFCAALTSNNIFFLSTKLLAVESTVRTSFKKVTSFAWSCDNKSFCFGGDKSYLCRAYSEVAESHKKFSQDINQHSVAYCRARCDALISAGKGKLFMLWQDKGKNILPLKGFKVRKPIMSRLRKIAKPRPFP